VSFAHDARDRSTLTFPEKETRLTVIELTSLLLICFLTSLVSVVTGSTSLITVPVLLQWGIAPRTALATNMLALTCMSVGGTVPFIGKNAIDRTRLPLLIAFTLASSLLGAWLVLLVPSEAIPLIVALAMIAVTVFAMAQPTAGIVPAAGVHSRTAEIAGYMATFVLGLYGGFFSGGYVTLLTVAYVAFFRMTFVEAVSITKVINIFSSLVATLVFLWRGLIDYQLGILLGAVMFLGANLGGHLALKMPNVWLRRVFLIAVVVLALKMLLYDVLGKMLRLAG
jgi:uncharacterized membrane protein YfcA